jgi:hypothetical protein
MFNIPVVLFIFKRKDTVFRIIDRISSVKPKTIYLISDAGRNNDEKLLVIEARESIEKYIDWDCEIIKNYADENMGVFNRIGEGAKWVLEREESAIFLEDDNLPELTFFKYCEDMLNKYKNEDQILWVVGTNYLGEYLPEDGSSYMFTQHMLPCGWASWSSKFSKFYDGHLENLNNYSSKEIKNSFESKTLYKQEVLKYFKTKYTLNKTIKLASWDSQIGFSLRFHNLYGISPKYNQIENIGVDVHATHGGSSYTKKTAISEMTRRFCGIKTTPLEFPLIHPNNVNKDLEYEARISKIVTYPPLERLKISIMTILKPVFGIDKYASFKTILKNRN